MFFKNTTEIIFFLNNFRKKKINESDLADLKEKPKDFTEYVLKLDNICEIQKKEKEMAPNLFVNMHLEIGYLQDEIRKLKIDIMETLVFLIESLNIDFDCNKKKILAEDNNLFAETFCKVSDIIIRFNPRDMNVQKLASFLHEEINRLKKSIQLINAANHEIVHLVNAENIKRILLDLHSQYSNIDTILHNFDVCAFGQRYLFD